MLPRGNWQTVFKWNDTRPLLCMTNTWLLNTVSTRCSIKDTAREDKMAKTLQDLYNEGKSMRLIGLARTKDSGLIHLL